MTPAEFVTRLEGVRSTGNTAWMARCPAHEDGKQSLSVGAGDGGRVLLNCFAGCTHADIVQALGLDEQDLFPPKEKPRREIVATYDYRDEGGELLYQVVRFSPKDFRQRKPSADGSGWEWKLGDVRRVLYRLPELTAADPAKPVFVVEGEKDADKLAGLGLVATCNVGGAGKRKWRDEYSAALKGRHVVVLPDNDEPGRKHSESVAASVAPVAASVRIVHLDDLPDKGDVSDWLRGEGHDAGRLVEIARHTPEWSPGAAAKPASTPPPDRPSRAVEFVSAPDRLKDDRARRKRAGERLIPFGITYLDDACRGILSNDLVLLGAKTGAGKTELATSIASLSAKAGRRTYMFALEAEEAEIERRIKYREIVRRLYAQGRRNRVQEISYLDWCLGFCDDVTGDLEADIDAHMVEDYEQLFTFYRKSESFNAKKLERALRQIKDDADLVVLDHLHYVDGEENQTENRALKRTAQTIRDAALSAGKPVIVVAHLRKKDRSRLQLVPEEDDFHGASDVAKMATRIVVLAPARDQPSKKPTVATTYVCVRKDRHAGGTGNMVALMGYEIPSRQYLDVYRLGYLNFKGDEWLELAGVDVPRWAKHAKRAPKVESEAA